ISKSMLARSGPKAPTRFERAIRFGLALRSALSDVPVGVASLTDRPLPHLFPTTNAEDFTAVVRRTLGIERPAPLEIAERATDFTPIPELAGSNYFPPNAKRRLVVLLSDGESRPFSPSDLADSLRTDHVGLLIVRFWHSDERVYDSDHKP